MNMTHKTTIHLRHPWSIGLLIVALMLPTMLKAEPVDKVQARQKALMFVGDRPHADTRGAAGVVKTDYLNLAVSNDAYHVFNCGKDEGFVIISGDDSMPDVLGYSDFGHFDTTDMPPALQNWLKWQAEEVKYAQEHHLPKYQPAKTRASGSSVGPLMTTKWKQGAPFNDGYPKVNGSTCITGCVATAMAQIMYYHKWPQGMTAEIPGYWSAKSDLDMPALPPTTFDWNNMLPVYNGSESAVQRAAVSKLMRYCSTAVRADLGITETTAYCPLIQYKKYFGYGNGIKEKYKNNYSTDGWKEIIYRELDEHRPIMCQGGVGENGHAYVVDGYDANGRLSVNWGWGGLYDGFYYMYSMIPDGTDYSVYTITIGISPNEIKYEYGDEDVVLTTTRMKQTNPNKFYIYSDQCNLTLDILYESQLKGTYDIDENFAVYRNGQFLTYFYSEEKQNTFKQMEPYEEYNKTTLYIKDYIMQLLKDHGVYKLVPVSRQHGTEVWKENIGSDTKYLTLINPDGKSIKVFVGEPNSELTEAEKAEVTNIYSNLENAVTEKLNTLNGYEPTYDAIKASIEKGKQMIGNMYVMLQSVQQMYDDYSSTTLYDQRMDIYNQKYKYNKDVSDCESELNSIDFNLYLSDNFTKLKTQLRSIQKNIKGQLALTEFMTKQEYITATGYEANSISNQVQASDVKGVTDQLDGFKKDLDDLNIQQLYDEVKAFAYQVNLDAHGGGMKGDVNGDSQVDGEDIIEVTNFILGKPSDQFKDYVADMNLDKKVDAADLVILIDMLSK